MGLVGTGGSRNERVRSDGRSVYILLLYSGMGLSRGDAAGGMGDDDVKR